MNPQTSLPAMFCVEQLNNWDVDFTSFQANGFSRPQRVMEIMGINQDSI
tara:strand:- start:285 stop:431 length:147 start_codon:yes stop_codon:yes gene_type:complete